MSTEFCVKFYTKTPGKSEAKLHDKVEAFSSEVEARIFALDYVRNLPEKGFISFWRIDPVGS